ncbi:MAG: kelch repeat-containing protein, partial [Myxococcota bacterium]|nr:kelch repeat-containing protein [Myxococcota bacterium]
WLEGSGVAGYRFDVVGLSSDRLQVQSRPSLSTPLAGHRAVLLPDGRLLVTGGHTVGSGLAAGQLIPVATTTLINPETGESGPGQQMLDARAYHAMAVFPGGPYQGQVLIAGGLGTAGDALITTEIFNPETGDFTRGPDLPEPRAYLDALPIRVPLDSEPLFLDNNIVLAFGERTRRGPQHSFADGLYSEVDENRREIWRTDGEVVQRISNGDSAALLETGRLFGRMVFQPSSRSIMFIGGGIDTIPTAAGCQQAPNNVCHCTSAEVPLCTEFSDCQDGQCETIRSYTRKDLATDVVEVHRDGQRFTLPPSGRLNRARAAFGIAQLPGDRVLVAGGVSAVRRNFWANEARLMEAPDTIDSVELWTPSDPASGIDGTWRVLLPLSVPREHFSLALLADGGVYAIGGMTPMPGGHRGVDLIERYDDDILRFIPVGNLVRGQAASQVILTEDAREAWLLGGEARNVPSNSIETVTLLSE